MNLEIRLTFVYGGVEITVTTNSTDNLTATLKRIAESVSEALVTEGISVTAPGEVLETAPPLPVGDIEDRTRYLAKEIGTAVSTLREVVHFGDDYPVLLAGIEEKTRTKQQRVALLCLGTVLDLVYQKPDVGTSLYYEMLRKSNVDPERLDLVLPRLKGLFIPKGKGRGRSYEITVPGRKKGLSLLQGLTSAKG